MMRLAERWLPSPSCGTLSRLAVRRNDPRWGPGALAAHAGICAGAASNRHPYRDSRFFNGLQTTWKM